MRDDSRDGGRSSCNDGDGRRGHDDARGERWWHGYDWWACEHARCGACDSPWWRYDCMRWLHDNDDHHDGA